MGQWGRWEDFQQRSLAVSRKVEKGQWFGLSTVSLSHPYFSAALLVQPRCSVFPGKVLSAGNRGRFGSQMEMTWGMK